MEVVAIASLVAMAVGGGYSAYSSYQQGKAQQTQAKAQAAESERQAELEMERAGIAQIQGEQEAAKRSRQLAADIGSSYANYAGNGLLVDGGTKDTLASVLKTQVAEGPADISTIKDNTALNIWTHESNAKSLLASAGNMRIAGVNAKRAGVNSAIGTSFSTVGQMGSAAASFNQAGAFDRWKTPTTPAK
jgi:hypothetical protein